MKPPSFDISETCYIALIPGLYTGTSPLIDAAQPYIFSGIVVGYRWEQESLLWWVEVKADVGRFWVRGECVYSTQDGAVHFLRAQTPDVCDSAMSDAEYLPCKLTPHGWTGVMPAYLRDYSPGSEVPPEVLEKASKTFSAEVQSGAIPYTTSDAAFFGLKVQSAGGGSIEGS